MRHGRGQVRELRSLEVRPARRGRRELLVVARYDDYASADLDSYRNELERRLGGGLELAMAGSATFVALTWLLTLRLPPLPTDTAEATRAAAG